MRSHSPTSLCVRLLVVLFAGLSFETASAGPILGDPDGDGDIDVIDFAAFQTCFFTAGQISPPGCDESFNFQPFTGIILADYALFLCGFSGPNVPVDAVAVGRVPAVTSQVDLALTGTTAGAVSVTVAGGLQPVTVPVADCDWTAFIQLQMNVVNHLFVTANYGDGIPSAPVPVNVTHDMQAPSLFIDFPTAGAELTTPTIDVAGRVGDTLSGFQGLTVVVKSVPVSPANPGDGDVGLPTPVVPAQVNIGVGTNGTFFAPAVPLEPGDNLIMAIASDASGNAAHAQITVTRVAIPPDSAQIEVISGNGQTAPVHAAVKQPIVVKLTNMKGTPLEGKLVNFHVTRSDGRLAADAPPLMPGTGTMLLQVFTDENGLAQAYWRLGSDAGSGNNRVEVTSADVVGTTIFCASALAGAPNQINISKGNMQRGEAGELAPELLDVWVNDACNPIPLVCVTFTVLQGGGTVSATGGSTCRGNEDAVVVPTGQHGHVVVNFTLGPQQGNNVVEANFDGNPHGPARFTIYGVERVAGQPTTLSGVVLDNGEQPIEGATATLTFAAIDCEEQVCTALSNISGQFMFQDTPMMPLPTGPATLRVDGASALNAPVDPNCGGQPVTFPSVPFQIVIVPEAANTLHSPVLLPRLSPCNERTYHNMPDPKGTNDNDTVLTVAGIEGLEMIIKAGSMTIDDPNNPGTLIPAPDGHPVSLNQVHHDDIPMPMPDGAAPPFAWTLRPPGAHFSPPVEVTYPNMSGLPAGAIANFLSFNHDSGVFQIIATGHVTDDALHVVTDPGVGLTIAGWGCNCPPYSVTADCCHCPDCEEQADSCCIPPCGPCETCQNGACDSLCCPNAVCCNGTCCDQCEFCFNGQCAEICDGCEFCNNGACESPCGICNPCQGDECMQIVCPACQHCQAGTCVAISCPICQHCDPQTGQCVDDSPCPDGSCLPNCVCYFTPDCSGGLICNFNQFCEFPCNHRLPKPEGVPGAGCNMDAPGASFGNCDGLCVPAPDGSVFGDEDALVLQQGIRIWAMAVLNPALQGGGPVDEVLARQASELPFRRPGVGELLGRHVAGTLAWVCRPELGHLYCYHEAHGALEGGIELYYIDLSVDSCLIEAANLAIEGLIAEMNAPGSARSYVDQIPSHCPNWQEMFEPTCAHGSDKLDCVTRRLSDLATYLTTPRIEP